MVTQRYLKEILSYDKTTGIFLWISYRLGVVNDGVAGTTINGYNSITIDQTKYPAHRLAWLYEYGEFPTGLIDHINQTKKNNRIENLRICDKSQNAANSKIRSDNKSGYKGVSWNKRDQKWEAYATHKSKKFNLGCFSDIIDAAKAYNGKALDLFGEYALLNEVN